jgi:hypothetical protein
MDDGDGRKQIVAGERFVEGKNASSAGIGVGGKCKTTREDEGAGGRLNAKWQVLSPRPSDGYPALKI